MLPIPLISDWSSSARLIPVLRRASRAANAAGVEGGLERVGGDVRDRLGDEVDAVGLGGVGAGLDRRDQRRDHQVAERALVGEAEVGAAVGEREAGADVRRELAVGLADQQLAAHAEVREECLVIVEGEPHVLAAAFRAGERAADHRGGEPGRAGGVAADRARVKDLGGGDGAADHVAFEARADGLDLGQLRHRRRRPSRAAAARSRAARLGRASRRVGSAAGPGGGVAWLGRVRSRPEARAPLTDSADGSRVGRDRSGSGWF